MSENKNEDGKILYPAVISQRQGLEQILELGQQRFQMMIKELNAAVFEWNITTNTYYSAGSFEKYAVSESSIEDLLNNKGSLSTVHPDDISKLQKFFQETQMGQEKVETVLRLKMKDQSYRWSRMLGLLFRDKQGKPLQKVGVIIDINEEREKNFMLSNLLNELPGGVAIFRVVGNKMECEYFSDGFAAMSGRGREEVAKMLESEELLKQGISLENYHDFVEKLKQDNGIGQQLSFTYHFINIDGSIGWLHVAATKIREEKGCPVYYCIYTNPTDETALFRSLVEDSAIGVFVADRKERRNLYCNGALKNICGFGDEKIEGKRVIDMIEGSDKKELISQEQVDGLFHDKYSEFHVERKNRYFTIKAKALIWNGVDSYVLYVSDETTEHQNQIRLQKIIDEVPSGIGIYEFKNGRLSLNYLNQAFYRMVGMDMEQSKEYLQPGNALLGIHKEDHPKVYAMLEKLLDGEDMGDVVLRVSCASNCWMWFHVSMSIVERKGRYLKGYASFSNCDAMIKAQEVVKQNRRKEQALMDQALREQEYYRIILSMTGTAYFDWDEKKGFYASKEYSDYSISQGGLDALYGKKNGKSCIHPNDLPVVMFYMHEIFENTEGKSITIRMKMKDGRYQWTEVTAYGKKNKQGKFTKLAGVLRNVDREWIERNRRLEVALKEAEKANQAKTAFLSRVSHDMRTPLNGILGLTSFLKDSITDKQAVRDISQLEISGQYLLNLINDTLDVSRIENGKLELHPTVCDGKTVLNNVIRLAKPGIEAKHLQFVVHTDDLPFTKLYIDVGRVEQIVMNIIGNAVKFTPEYGTIEFKMENLSVTEDEVIDRVSIRDTGIGMSEDFLPKIFDAFSQADNSRTSSRQGTGLGMAITKQLVELMGGKITVESKIGKGSCFTFTIVMKKATEEQIRTWEESRKQSSDQFNLKDKKVLLCEDHPLNTQIATRLLNKKGIVVTCAKNGQEGCEKFKQAPLYYYDAILMDVRMPVMDGMDATRTIRKMNREDACRVPIIAMTGNSFDEDVQRTLDSGMNAHLSKPIDAAKLFETLGEQISTKQYYQRKKILIVDDIEMNRAVIQSVLEPDYDIVEAENGVDALKVLHREPIDLIITDVMMMKMDGIELARTIRTSKEYNHIALIVNTQYGQMKLEEELLRIGVDEFLYKPNTPENIILKVREALNRKKIRS